MEDGNGEMINLNTCCVIQNTMYTLLSIHHLLITIRPFLFSGRPCIRETNGSRGNDRRFCDRMSQLSTSVKEPKKIIWYSNQIEHEKW
ncbi:hypothetical protein TNCV_2209461 [Trichonephila clavipes]|nr:hypothetical protein TNCV_2209461 [Trichonephila clavipes]